MIKATSGILKKFDHIDLRVRKTEDEPEAMTKREKEAREFVVKMRKEKEVREKARLNQL